MRLNEQVSKRFAELESLLSGISYPAGAVWHQWVTSVESLLRQTFTKDSDYYRGFLETQDYTCEQDRLETSKGVFLAAKSDFERGYLFSVESVISREVIGSFISLAKAALQEGQKDVAAVLAFAALEDALKRYALREGLEVRDKNMQEVISALKSKRLVEGAKKELLDKMPKLRDYAMHAQWENVESENVGAIIAYVEEFLVKHFR